MKGRKRCKVEREEKGYTTARRGKIEVRKGEETEKG